MFERFWNILELFAPRVLRGSLVYPDLSQHALTAEERIWFIENIWLPNRQLHEVSEEILACRYGFAKSTVRRWADQFSKYNSINVTMGRPSLLDLEGIQKCKAAVIDNQKTDSAPDEVELTKILVSEMTAVKWRQNNVLTEDPCLKSVQKYIGMVATNVVTPQITSNARYVACSDYRMSYAQWILVFAFTSTLPPNMIWNWDATQFICRTQGSGRKVYIVKMECARRPTMLVQNDSLAIIIKWMHMGSASGTAIPIVLLVAISDMKEDEMVLFEIPGLTYGVEREDMGYVAFCKTRAGNSRFFNWFATVIAIPTIVHSRKFHNSKVCVCELIFYI